MVTKRVTDLLVGGKNYFIMPPPTYSEFPVEQVLNIKTVSDKPVYGDGVTDDTQNINDILAQNRDCKVIYFPAAPISSQTPSSFLLTFALLGTLTPRPLARPAASSPILTQSAL